VMKNKSSLQTKKKGSIINVGVYKKHFNIFLINL